MSHLKKKQKKPKTFLHNDRDENLRLKCKKKLLYRKDDLHNLYTLTQFCLKISSECNTYFQPRLGFTDNIWIILKTIQGMLKLQEKKKHFSKIIMIIMHRLE